MNRSVRSLTTTGIAMVSIFAALQAVLSIWPFTITLGIAGQITLGVLGGPLIGLLLGPFLGGISVLIGSLIGMWINPSGAIFGIFTVLPPTVGAIGAGFMIKKRGYVPAGIILVSILAFYAHPFGRESLVYPWLHVVAVVIALVSSTRILPWSTNRFHIKKISLSIPIAAFIGTLSDHMIGSALAIWLFDLPSEVWNTISVIYPIERILAVILISLVGIPLMYSLQKAGFIDKFSRNN